MAVAASGSFKVKGTIRESLSVIKSILWLVVQHKH